MSELENSNFTFRTPIEQKESYQESIKSDGDLSTSDYGVEPNFSEYSFVEGVPFTAGHYGLKPVFNELPRETKNQVQVIEKFIEQKIKSREFVDNPESGKQIISEIEKRLNLGENNDPYYKIEKISDFLTVVPETPIEPKELKQTIKKVMRSDEKVKEFKTKLKETKQEYESVLESKKNSDEIVKKLQSQITKNEKTINKVKEQKDNSEKMVTESKGIIDSLGHQMKTLSTKLSQEKEKIKLVENKYKKILDEERKKSIQYKSKVSQLLKAL